jgi:hypothetical protein
MENMKKTLAIAILIFMSSCTNSQKQAIVKQDIPVMSFSAQNQLDQTDNSMSWIVKQGVVEYDVHWGWKCSDKGDKSFLWLEQKQVKETKEEQTLNVSRGNCL